MIRQDNNSRYLFLFVQTPYENTGLTFGGCIFSNKEKRIKIWCHIHSKRHALHDNIKQQKEKDNAHQTYRFLKDIKLEVVELEAINFKEILMVLLPHKYKFSIKSLPDAHGETESIEEQNKT